MNIRKQAFLILGTLSLTTHIFSMKIKLNAPTDETHKQLTITNKYSGSYIRINPKNFFMSEYFMPNDTRTIVGSVDKDKNVKLSVFCQDLAEESRSLTIPSDVNHITIQQENDTLKFVTDKGTYLQLQQEH